MLFLFLSTLLLYITYVKTKEGYDSCAYDTAKDGAKACKTCETCGKIVAGTVWVNDSQNTPGLGWVL
jgi:hypothetical protein